MAKSAITFQKAKGHSYKHNFRKDEPNYLLEPQDRKENSYWQSERTPKEIFNDELKKANRKGGRIPKFENSYWEAVCNLNANHNLDDLKKLAEHIEKKFNITCTAIAIHRDEGHYNDKGKAEYNYHAHINFMTYKDGRQNWRKELIKPDDLRELQTETAEILGMERGKDKRETGRERLEHKEYKAIAKEKQALIQELEAVKLSKKEIKEQFEAFRKENAGQGLAKEFFKELSDEKKKQLQEPSYTQDELKAYFTELLEKHTSKKKGIFSEKEVIDYEKIIQEQQQTISDLNTKNDNLKQIANKTIEFIDKKVEIDLNAKFDLLKQQNEIQLNEQLKKRKNELEYELIQEKNQVTIEKINLQNQIDYTAKIAAATLKAEQEHKAKIQELEAIKLSYSENDVVKELKKQHEEELEKERENQAKLEEQNENLKLDNERLRMLNEFAMNMKEKAEEELKEIKKRLQDITEAVERAVKGSWQIVYDRSAYGFKSAHIKLKEFFSKEPQEQERIINSNIQAHKDIETEKEQTTKKERKGPVRSY